MTEPDTKELDALLGSLNTSAERFQTLWFSFLGLTLYLAIAALTTTHRNLLLGDQQMLPILNIKIPLLPFYAIAPLLYLVFHFYVLMMLVLLARTAATFEQELRTMLPGDVKQEKYRARVANALFLQILIGRKQERAGCNGILLSLIARITIVLATLATLILIQLSFLPYHSIGMTWWHRALIFTDIILIIMLWRSYSVQNSIEWPFLQFVREQRLREGLVWVGYLSLLVVVFWLSLWEGRWAGEPWIGRRGFVSTANGVVFGLFPDRLKLNNEVIVDETKLKDRRGGEFVPTIKFEDRRHLEAADLSGTDLRGVSLSGAAMQGANLVGARLDGAILTNAQLDGANLREAQARGVQLGSAKLQGALLGGARLEGAILDGAQLQAAELSYAKLQGASLLGSQLQGADLFFAQLQGADLGFARLQGANLKGAQLQGAHLARSETGDSEFDTTFVFRTDTADANLSTAVVQFPQADGVKLNDKGVIEPLLPADLEMWIAAATEFAREREKAFIAERFVRLKPTFQTSEQDAADHAKWDELARQSVALDPTRAQHRLRLAAILGDLACKVDGAPYVARILEGDPSSIARGIGILMETFGDRRDDVRQRLKAARNNPQTCPGVAGFTEDDWQRLGAIRPAQDQPSP